MSNGDTQVFVGMSGGVDSSVTAALLLEQGYRVTGVYMKNWTKDLPGFTCPWQQDYQDAKRVAVQLGIDLKVYDFEQQYRQKVVDYMVAGYQAGITPNPDVMCNQEVKFKLFLDTARADGADKIATGHYARSVDGQLLTGLDANKDQSYFLYRVSRQALEQSLMPIGDLTKPMVRAKAHELGLATADKKDSQGICFVGKVGIKEFLLAELGLQAHGDVIDQHGAQVGEHDGALFYTIGQRHGLNVGGGLPYYVVGKDMTKNTVLVTTNLQDDRLWNESVELTNMHWISGEQPATTSLQVMTRYRTQKVSCEIQVHGATATLHLSDAIRAITPGQSAVLYHGDVCLGGGIVI